MGAKRLFHPVVAAAVCAVLTAFGGTGLAVTLRSSALASPTPSPAAFERFELPGEQLPVLTPTRTVKPTATPPAPKEPRAVPTPKPPLPTPSPPPPPPPPPPSPKQVVVPTPKAAPVFAPPKPGIGANNTALLIGVNEAPGSDVLQGMVEDTRTMRTMLLRAGYKSENIKVLTDGKATRPAILDALDALARRTSGKGLAVVSISSHSGVSGGDMTFATGGGGRVSRAELASRLGKVRGRLWTTISTCYSAAYDTPGITGRDRIAMFTASKDELSYQNAAGSISIVYMVGTAMLERGIRSVEDAYAHAKDALRAAGAGEKVPILKDGIPGDVVPGLLH